MALILSKLWDEEGKRSQTESKDQGNESSHTLTLRLDLKHPITWNKEP